MVLPRILETPTNSTHIPKLIASNFSSLLRFGEVNFYRLETEEHELQPYSPL
jgi:hypothetical protein